MDLQRTKLLLLTGSTVLGAGTLLLIAWALWIPIAASASADRRALAVSPDSVSLRADEPRIEDFAQIWEKPLRRSLSDSMPPPDRPTVVSNRFAPLNLQLLGTMVEPDQARALFATHRGELEVRRVGESIGNPPASAELLRIEPKAVRLRYRNQDFTLVLREE